jgi:hypothetical protein
MENRFAATRTELLRRAKLNPVAVVMALALAGCAAHPPPLNEDPAKPQPIVSKPNNTPVTPLNPAELESLFPVGQARPLFDGVSLKGWDITDFAGHGEVTVENVKGSPAIVLEPGASLTGVTWTNAIPKMDYEAELDAMKLIGSDFFCGWTFPVGDSFCTFICGGWGGAVVGISSIDGQDASMNETTKYLKFEDDRWYRVKVRVTRTLIEAWIDANKMVDLETTGKTISMRLGEIEESEPFGIATYQTRAALRNITLRRLPPSK